MSKVVLLVLFIPLFLIPSSSSAESSVNKKAIFFACSCSDAVGQLYATAFRDVLASSPRYKEASQAEVKNASGDVQTYNITVQAVSLDPSGDSRGSATVVSVVLLVGNTIFLDNMIQTCGKEVVSTCAAKALASIDGDLHPSTTQQ